MADCLFCSIVSGEAPSHTVYADDRTVVFMDIFPLSKGHCLVVPRNHCRDLVEASAEDVAACARVAQRVTAAAFQGLSADGVNVIQSNGAVAFQTVFHLHFHVLPRYQGDGFQFPVSRHRATPEELDEGAAALRGALI
ncbi:MAG TPA: HIT family protein [Acidimicrobiales bacterium]|nr:HIT family protein [Acidimicrobiales bacterium]